MWANKQVACDVLTAVVLGLGDPSDMWKSLRRVVIGRSRSLNDDISSEYSQTQMSQERRLAELEQDCRRIVSPPRIP